MSVHYIPAGQLFVEQCQPVLAKNEFGMDTMTRKFRGPAPRLAAYLLSLRQGQAYLGFYLQTWNADDNPVFPTVTMLYKGLINGIPNPLITDDTSQQTVTISTTTPSSASRNIQFYANQSTYRYITNKRPTGFQYFKATITDDPIVLFSEIKDQDGRTYFGNAPAALVTALTPAVVDLNTGHSVIAVYGTPWFECQDSAIRTFHGG